MASLGIRVTRALFGAGEKLAPPLAGRAAFELFARTPNPRRPTDGERKAMARAAHFMQTARHHRIKVGPDCVAVHEFRTEPGVPEIGRALVIHGWRSRTEYMRTIIESLRDAGFRVFSLDLPGHGESTGRRLTIMKAVEAVRMAAQWFGPFDTVVCHSFGGAVAVNAMAKPADGGPPALVARRLVLIASPNSIVDVLDGFAGHIGLGGRGRRAMVARIERLAGRELESFNGSNQLSRLDVPTLVVHAPDDREVPAEDAQGYATAGPHVKLHWAPGLGHRRILVDAGVAAAVVDFARPPRSMAA